VTPASGVGHVGVRLRDGWRERVDPAWLAGWAPEVFDLGDGTTEVVSMGEGPAVLLLPSLPGFKEAWIAVAHRLAHRYRVVTFDLRTRFPGAPTWQALVADVERVADAFAPGRAAVIGHSLGGALAQHWVLRRPERVRALVLSSSFARIGGGRGQWGKRWLEQPGVLALQRWLPEALAARLATRDATRGVWVYDTHCDARMLAFVRHAIRTLPVGVGARAVRLAFAHDTREALARIDCPTLVVIGEHETAWARAASDDLAARIPGATLRRSPGVAHLHPLSGAEWLATAASEWIAAH